MIARRYSISVRVIVVFGKINNDSTGHIAKKQKRTLLPHARRFIARTASRHRSTGAERLTAHRCGCRGTGAACWRAPHAAAPPRAARALIAGGTATAAAPHRNINQNITLWICDSGKTRIKLISLAFCVTNSRRTSLCCRAASILRRLASANILMRGAASRLRDAHPQRAKAT